MYFWEVFGGVLDVFLWNFGRFLDGKNKGKIKEKQCINNII